MTSLSNNRSLWWNHSILFQVSVVRMCFFSLSYVRVQLWSSAFRLIRTLWLLLNGSIKNENSPVVASLQRWWIQAPTQDEPFFLGKKGRNRGWRFRPDSTVPHRLYGFMASGVLQKHEREPNHIDLNKLSYACTKHFLHVEQSPRKHIEGTR